MSPKTQQPQDVTESWAEAQKRLWDIFEAQSAAVFAAFDQIAAAPNVPQPLRTQLHQLQELTRNWTETQRKLWDATFAALGQATPRAEQKMTPTLPLELWQQFSRPVLEAQAAWLRQWSGVLAGAPQAGPNKQ